MTEKLARSRGKFRVRARRWLLAFLLYALAITVLMLFFPWSALQLSYFMPSLSVFLFLGQWFDPTLLILLLILLPLIGWVIGRCGKAVGRYLITVPQFLLLGASILVFAIHFITSLGQKSPGALTLTFLLLLVPVAYCVPVLILSYRWYPTIKDR